MSEKLRDYSLKLLEFAKTADCIWAEILAIYPDPFSYSWESLNVEFVQISAGVYVLYIYIWNFSPLPSFSVGDISHGVGRGGGGGISKKL